MAAKRHTDLVIRLSRSAMPISCKGVYFDVHVLEVEPGVVPRSKSAKGVRQILWSRFACHAGDTARSGAGKAIDAAARYCRERGCRDLVFATKSRAAINVVRDTMRQFGRFICFGDGRITVTNSDRTFEQMVIEKLRDNARIYRIA